MRLRIIGLDLALGGSGYADPDGFTTTVRPPGFVDGYHRHNFIADAVVANLRKDAPDVAIVEAYAGGGLGRLAMYRAGELGGIIRGALARYAIDLVEVAPSQLKLWATGKGNAKKPAMIAAAVERGALLSSPTAHDEADAFLLWLLGRSYLTLGEAHDVFDRILWPLKPVGRSG